MGGALHCGISPQPDSVDLAATADCGDPIAAAGSGMLGAVMNAPRTNLTRLTASARGAATNCEFVAARAVPMPECQRIEVRRPFERPIRRDGRGSRTCCWIILSHLILGAAL